MLTPVKLKLRIVTIGFDVEEASDDDLDLNEHGHLPNVAKHYTFPGCSVCMYTAIRAQIIERLQINPTAVLYRPCQVMTAPRDIYTSHFRPVREILVRGLQWYLADAPPLQMLNPGSHPLSMPPGPDFHIHNGYDGRSRRRIGFREGPIAGVGMLDLLTFRDRFTDSHLSAPEFFGRGASYIQFAFCVGRLFSTWFGGLEQLCFFLFFHLICQFDDRYLPPSSSHYEVLPIQCWCSSDRTVSRYHLALYVSYVFWLHQHVSTYHRLASSARVNESMNKAP